MVENGNGRKARGRVTPFLRPFFGSCLVVDAKKRPKRPGEEATTSRAHSKFRLTGMQGRAIRDILA